MADLLQEMPHGGHARRHVFGRTLITFDRLGAGHAPSEQSS
jgi:hypothetical protein